MAEPAHPTRTAPRSELRAAEHWPLNAADFPGCRAIRIAPEDIEDHEGRVEYWEARTATAMVVCEPTTTYHERPGHRLAGLAERLAASRGAPIASFGTADLVRFDGHGKPRVLMQADQILYLRPPSAEELAPKVDVDGGDLPDVVLEVDYSTDIRVRKLPLYDAWGFPEVWVDVPDVGSPSRPKSRRPGLSIHVRQGGRLVPAESSRAFPGWTAEEIHRALNESPMSAATVEALHRVGAALAAAEGGGPDDDPWLRRYVEDGRAEGRSTGRSEGRAEGLAAGRSEGRIATKYESVAAVLRERGIETTAVLSGGLVLVGELPVAALVRLALRCSSEREFLELCAAESRQVPDSGE